MKIIKLSSKKYPDIETMVDDEDYEILSHYKWYPTINPKNNTTYVAVIINHKITQMHRYIMQLHDYDIKDKDIDHEDQNGLNNQKYNLRPCSKNNNQHNRKKNKNGTTSKYKGVCLRKNKYRAQIRFKTKLIHIGCFVNEDDAGRAYNEKALELFGEFARLNIIK